MSIEGRGGATMSADLDRLSGIRQLRREQTNGKKENRTVNQHIRAELQNWTE
jgi:hypothetical protein